MRFEKSTNLFDIPSFKKGSGIHIKKKNRGKFTEYCNGKVTQKCIDKAKKSKNPTLRKGNNYYEQYILPQIQQQFEKKGYKAVGSDTYSNGKFSITDLFEENIART